MDDVKFIKSKLSDLVDLLNSYDDHEKLYYLKLLYEFNTFTCCININPIKDPSTIKVENNLDYDKFKLKVKKYFSDSGYDEYSNLIFENTRTTLKNVVEDFIPKYDIFYDKALAGCANEEVIALLEPSTCVSYFKKEFEKSLKLINEKMKNERKLGLNDGKMKNEEKLDNNIYEVKSFGKFYDNETEYEDDYEDEIFPGITDSEIKKIAEENGLINELTKDLTSLELFKNRKVLAKSIEIVSSYSSKSYFKVMYAVLFTIFKIMGFTIQIITFGYHLVRFLKDIYFDNYDVDHIENLINKNKLDSYLFPKNTDEKYKKFYYGSISKFMTNPKSLNKKEYEALGLKMS